jgi:hypothetical protein
MTAEIRELHTIALDETLVLDETVDMLYIVDS